MAIGASGFRWIAAPLAIALTTTLALPAPTFAGIDEAVKREEEALPKTPTAPPLLYRAAPEEQRHCGRIILYQGRHLDCDSELFQDGERLRPLISDTPAALDELNLYQQNRESLRSFAYVGTAGLLLALSGSLFPKLIPGAEHSGTIRTLLIAGGLGVTAGTVIYGMTFLTENEKHLRRAIDLHNEAKPEEPIELLIQATFTF